jgi:hypothetical protein
MNSDPKNDASKSSKKPRQPKNVQEDKMHIHAEVVMKVRSLLKNDKFRKCIRKIYSDSKSKIHKKVTSFNTTTKQLMNLLTMPEEEEGASS